MRTGNGSNSNATEEHTILARAAFGRESCVKLERNGKGTWLRVGKKSGEAWDWKKAKLSDVEIAELLLVLELRQEQAETRPGKQRGGLSMIRRTSVNP